MEKSKTYKGTNNEDSSVYQQFLRVLANAHVYTDKWLKSCNYRFLMEDNIEALPLNHYANKSLEKGNHHKIFEVIWIC